MNDNAIIFKSMGLCPSEKSLIGRIKHKLNPKGHHDLKLRSKVFITVIFNHSDDYIMAFEGVPYFSMLLAYTHDLGKTNLDQKGKTSKRI